MLIKKYEFYTDGACSGNPGPGGFGVVHLEKCGNALVIYWNREEFSETTNNRMELSAIIDALTTILDELEPEDLTCPKTDIDFIIHSDSAYAVNICNDWIWKWADNNWTRAKGKPIENLDLVKELYILLNRIQEQNIHCKIQKCAGHADILGNELADALASANINKFKKLQRDNNIIDGYF